MCADPKSAKKTVNSFVFLGSAGVKAVCKQVDEIDPKGGWTLTWMTKGLLLGLSQWTPSRGVSSLSRRGVALRIKLLDSALFHIPLPLYLSLSLSLSNTLSHSLSLSLFLFIFHSLSRDLTHPHTHTLPISLTSTHTHMHTFSLYLFLLTHTHSLSLSF